MKALKGITFVLTITTVVSIIVIILMCTGVIKICDNTSKTTNDITVDTKELSKIKDGDYNYIKLVNTKYGTYYLLSNGKVNIDLERELSNINNAIDMALLNDELIILTKDGKVYKYYTGITTKATLEADLANVENVVKLVEYGSRRKDAGGCNYIIGITSDNSYVTLLESCV